MKESDFMVIYNYDKYQDYKFEYKKDHILVKKFYTKTSKYVLFDNGMYGIILSAKLGIVIV